MRLDYVMRIVSLLGTAIVSPVSIDRHDPPLVDRVEPNVTRPGAVVTAFGANLDRSRVQELILSSPESIALVHIVEQQEDRIRFEIPRAPAARRYSIVLALMNHLEPELVDQQVFIMILID